MKYQKIQEYQSKACECGCGQPAPIATKTRRIWGHVKGLPVRFIRGHAGRKQSLVLNNFSVDIGTGCWNWQGAKNSKGYGQIRWEGRNQYVHRLMWERCHGPIPEGYDIDHLCRNHSCLNPDHLEPVTRPVNVKRGIAADVMVRCTMCNRLTTKANPICKLCCVVEVEENTGIPVEAA